MSDNSENYDRFPVEDPTPADLAEESRRARSRLFHGNYPYRSSLPGFIPAPDCPCVHGIPLGYACRECDKAVVSSKGAP